MEQHFLSRSCILLGHGTKQPQITHPTFLGGICVRTTRLKISDLRCRLPKEPDDGPFFKQYWLSYGKYWLWTLPYLSFRR